VLELTDGTHVSGRVEWHGDVAEVTTDNGTTWVIPKTQLARLTETAPVSPAEAAKAEWDSVSDRIAGLNDLNAIIEAHQKFLDKFGNEPSAEKAKASLARFQELQGKNAVKFRGKWMPAADVTAMKQAWEQHAQPAVRAYNSGEMQNAIAEANAALKTDATNPVALTVIGLVQLQAKDLARAGVTFKTILNTDPADAIALNNLAVIAWRQNRPRQAFVYYAQAIDAAPGNRLIMDNIAEALAAQGRIGDSLATRLFAQWKKNEPEIETQLAQQGLSRWGAVWIDARQRKTLETLIAQNQESLRTAQQQLNSDAAAVNSLDGAVADNDRAYDDASQIDDPDEADLQSDRVLQQSTQLRGRLREAHSAANESAQQVEAIQNDLDELYSTQFTGVQRIMRLGEDAKPPPPARVTIPQAR
jgi:Tfp pilus assembly protein PilF